MHAIGRSAPLAVYRGALAVAIVVGSLAMWIGIPLFWIWVAGRLIDEYPSIYLLALAACPLTMIGWGWMLYRLNAIYVEIAPRPDETPGSQRSAWLGSLSDNRRPRRREATLLDVSMIVSVIIALAAMAVWFFAFAHNTGPLPD
jgi:hypothetical protein